MLSRLRQELRRQLAMARDGTLKLGPGTQSDASHFGQHVRLGPGCVALRCRIGDRTYLGPRCVAVDATIGRFCAIASEVHLGTGSHPTRDYASIHPIFYLARPALGWSFVAEDRLREFAPTTVGNDVWIGARAIVRDGVTIGDGAIIGAGAVVVGDIEPYAIYGGVPARRIRMRFADDDVAMLLRLRWWDRDEAWLRTHLDAFTDVARLRTLAPTDGAG